MPHAVSRRVRTALGAGAALVLSVAAAAMPSPAAQGATAPTIAPWEKGWIRVADLVDHGSDAQVRLTSFARGRSVTLDASGYGAVSSYRGLRPGLYAVSTRSDHVGGWALDTVIQVRRSTAYTVLALAGRRTLDTQVLLDDVRSPAPGKVRVRMIAADPSVKAVRARVVHGPVLARHLEYGTATGYGSVPAQTWNVSTRPAQAHGSAVTKTVRLRGGHNYTLLVLGGGASPRMVKVPDSLGAGPTPAAGLAGSPSAAAGSSGSASPS